jgi:Uma2 family endonuclease
MYLDPGSSTPHSRRGRAPLALVVYDPPPEELGAPIDWSAWYLTDEDDMSEGIEQGVILQGARSSLITLAEERAWANTFVGHDNFFAWVEEEPLVRVSPDVYLLDDPPPGPWPKMWQTWLPGHKPPRWALEIVSDDWKKDYELNPPKYAQLGARELVLFDPEAAASPDARRGSREARKVRVPLQVYRRGADGALVLVYRGDGPAFSEEIGAFLVVQKDGGRALLRIARDAAGTDIVPTAEERAKAAEESNQAAQERAKAAEESTKAAQERAKAAEERAQTAEERIQALEAELARVRSPK